MGKGLFAKIKIKKEEEYYGVKTAKEKRKSAFNKLKFLKVAKKKPLVRSSYTKHKLQ